MEISEFYEKWGYPHEIRFKLLHVYCINVTVENIHDAASLCGMDATEMISIPYDNPVDLDKFIDFEMPEMLEDIVKIINLNDDINGFKLLIENAMKNLKYDVLPITFI